jgi:hypothetical protein
MDTRVCEAKCRQKEACPEYLMIAKLSSADDPPPSQLPLPVARLSAEPESLPAA